jgi:hypothetical protein
MNQFPPAPEYYIGALQIFSKILGDICKSRCTTGINATGVSMTPAANFSTIFLVFATGVNDTGGKQWEQLSNC